MTQSTPFNMSSDNIDVRTRKAELLHAFMQQVPGRVAAILENWHRLVQSDWDPELFAKLRDRISTIAEAADKFGVKQIENSAQSLQAHLSQHTGTMKKPVHDEIVTLDGLVHAFKDAALDTCKQLPAKPPTEREQPAAPASTEACRIYLLGIDDSQIPGLSKHLKAMQYKIGTFANASDLMEKAAGGTSQTCALISHIRWLPELFPDSRQGGLWHEKEGSNTGMPVAFIADSSDLQTRLQAMRTNASAFWAKPIDAYTVAQRMVELTTQQRHVPYRVLVVEDDPAQAVFATSILNKAGFETHSVTDPLQVMEVLHDFKPDLILMDLYMPGASGAELTAVIREQNEFVDTPIVFLSGEQDLDKQLKALSFGGEDFLSKPIGPKHLISTVTNRIRRAKEIHYRLGIPDRLDKATGLFARHYLLERVEMTLSTDTHVADVPAVLHIEIDNPEKALDVAGIGGMDVILSETGNIISGLLQPQDVLARFGDSSLGLLACRDKKEDLAELAEQLCETVADKIIELERNTIGITISVGICIVDGSNQDAGSIVSKGQWASRMAHNAGGNQTYLYNPPKAAKGDEEDNLWLANLVQEAMQKNLFQIYFQPMVSLQGSANAHYQTLLRLKSPNGQLLTAATFISVAEELGVIGKLDQWTSMQAISIIAENRGKSQEVRLFVSQSSALLNDLERMSWLQEQHRTGRIQEGELTFEFRLSDIIHHLKSAKTCFETLHKMGISTLLTGVSNTPDDLRTLKHLALRFIKIDRALLNRNNSDLKELITTAHNLGVKVIAPQVEDPSSIAKLWSSGADFVQGNFVQRPENNLIYDFDESVLQ